jgi:ribosomal protein S18 acetylase RimI-like enzyme
MSHSEPAVQIRPASIEDIEDLLSLRVEMFKAMGHAESLSQRVIDAMRSYFEQYLPTGAFRVWVAEHKNVPIASIGLVIHSIPPSPSNAVGKEAYIMNLVTRPEYRRQGIARRLMGHVLDVIHSEGIPKVSLHAARAGRRLYDELGFHVSTDTPEMTLTFDS